jgi:hypothetical protein
MSFDEGRSLLEMEDQLSSKEDVISRMSSEERQYHAVRCLIVYVIFYSARSLPPFQLLKVMIEVYLQPLRDSLLSMNPIISQDDIRIIFSTLETIYSFSGKLLSTITAASKVHHI